MHARGKGPAGLFPRGSSLLRATHVARQGPTRRVQAPAGERSPERGRRRLAFVRGGPRRCGCAVSAGGGMAGDVGHQRGLVGELSGGKLRVQQLAVNGDLEAAAIGWRQLQPGDLALERREQSLRQTDGLRLVVSQRAVTDVDIHRDENPWRTRCLRGRRRRLRRLTIG